MSVQTKAGSFSSGTAAAGNTVAVSGLGFAPKAVIFWTSGRSESTSTTGDGTHHRCMGFGTSPTSRHCVMSFSANASASADSEAGHRNDACVARINASGTDEGRLDIQSLDADGFTLVVDTQFTAAERIAYLAIGGDSITNQGTEVITASAGTGTVDYTGLGFTPSVVLFIGAGLLSAPPGVRADSCSHIGWATGSGANANAHVSGASTDASPNMVCKHNSRRTECIARYDPFNGVITGRANLSAFIANGYRLNWIEGDSSTPRYSVLALAGLSAAVGQTASKTDTTDTVITGLGFKPAGVVFISATDVESTQDTLASWDPWTMGASDGTNMVSHTVEDIDGIATSQIETGVNFANVYTFIAQGGALDGAMEVRTLDADGFTTRMTNPDSVAAWISYLALGPFGAAAGPPGPNALALLGVGQ